MVKVKKEKLYPPEAMEKALTAVSSGLGLRQAARQFGVPFSTLLSRHKGQYTIDTRKGPHTVLSSKKEKDLVRWILDRGNAGFPVSRGQVLDSVKIGCQLLKKKTPFVNSRPSNKWYTSFMKRHNELAVRKSQNLTKRRSDVTAEALENWFQRLYEYLKNKNLLEIDASRVFNLDESAFFLAPGTKKVIVRRGQKARYSLSFDDKECLTALITCNAKGQLVTGLVLFKGSRLPANVMKFLPNTFSAGKTVNGWLTGESFYEYFTNVFYPWCLKEEIRFPIIVYLDGHGSHFTLPLSEFCIKKQIELIPLYPNSTHLIQPLDVGLFAPLEQQYRTAVAEWVQEHNGHPLTKENLATVLTTALRSLNLEEIIPPAFEASGLYPLNANAVSYHRILGDKPNDTSDSEQKPSANLDTTSSVCLSVLEKSISAEILEMFKQSAANGIWEGPECSRDLFDFWLKCYTASSSQVDVDIHTSSNSSLTIETEDDSKDIILFKDIF